MKIIAENSSDPVIVDADKEIVLLNVGVTLSGEDTMIQSAYGATKFYIDGSIFVTGTGLKAAMSVGDASRASDMNHFNQIFISATGKLFSETGSGLKLDSGILVLNNAGTISGAIGMSIKAGAYTIFNSGLIHGEQRGVSALFDARGSIYNTGTISAGIVAVELSYGVLSNQGQILGCVSVYDGTATNSGTIIGTLSGSVWDRYSGIALSHGSALDNSGLIKGNAGIMMIYGSGATLDNAGRIAGLLTYGVEVQNEAIDSTIDNSGTISGKLASIFCGTANDTVTNSGKLIGDVQLGGGNDVFDTRGGTVKGLIYGGDGDDSYYVDTLATAKAVSELSRQGTDHVFSGLSLTLGDNIENLTLLGTGNLNGSGNSLANRLTGNDGNNRLTGASGNDRLDGGSGADLLDGGSGTDTADYAASDAAVRIDLATLKVSGGDAAGDVLVSIENVTGSRFGDVLTGSKGANVLDGGAGNDRLTGGLGKDVFVFNGSFGKDTVTDFDKSQDRIDLSTIAAITDFADLKSHHLSQHGQDTLITVSSGNVITLTHVDMDDLTAGQFLF